LVNVWVDRSIKLARSYGYLDKLALIYPPVIPSDRPLNAVTKQRIRELHSQGEGQKLLKLLLDISRRGCNPFPIEHPYVPLLRRKKDGLFNKNPMIVDMLAQILLSLPVDAIIRGCERPADINRIMGSAFRNWLRSYFPQQGYPVLPKPQFRMYRGIAFLDATNARVMEYANRELGCNLRQGRDFLCKVFDKFIVGEARFMSTYGGSQTRDLRSTLDFVKDKTGSAIRVAVLDGIMWFYPSYVNMLRELGEDEYALSALLLKDFLESLR